MPLSGLDVIPHEKAWESLHFPELSLSVGKTSQIFFTQISGGCSSVRQESPFQRWPQGTNACQEQISPEILLQHPSQAKIIHLLLCRETSSLAYLQPDHSSFLTAVWGEGRTYTRCGICQGWRVRIWVRCGSRGDRQRGFPRACLPGG